VSLLSPTRDLASIMLLKHQMLFSAGGTPCPRAGVETTHTCDLGAYLDLGLLKREHSIRPVPLRMHERAGEPFRRLPGQAFRFLVPIEPRPRGIRTGGLYPTCDVGQGNKQHARTMLGINQFRYRLPDCLSCLKDFGIGELVIRARARACGAWGTFAGIGMH
jgi:hypothetical protein